MTRICLMSDTHGYHRKVEVPNCDILIHCGDFTAHGREADARDFNDWMGTLPCKHRISISGNHDWVMTRFKQDQFNHFDSVFSRARQAELTSNYTYLCDSGVTINGINFWGSPVTPQFCDWAFMIEGETNLAHHWKKIPNGTNVLITHGPARGILDRNVRGEECGDEQLRERVKHLDALYLHVCGHLHENFGGREVDTCRGEGTPDWWQNRYYATNVSILDEHYNLKNAPIVVDYEELVRTRY